MGRGRAHGWNLAAPPTGGLGNHRIPVLLSHTGVSAPVAVEVEVPCEDGVGVCGHLFVEMQGGVPAP